MTPFRAPPCAAGTFRFFGRSGPFAFEDSHLDTLLHFVNLVLHIDAFLGDFIRQYGAWVYLVLFLIVFCETGLVVLPFLPGDSLLFIGGAFAATGDMNVGALIVLLLVAAISGNTVNYLIGRWIGPKVFNTHIPVLERFLDRAALQKTHSFYDKHGGKTIVLARFIPVVRTFAPFVAGASSMSVARFQLFNVLGAVFWVLLLVLLGYFFGNIPFIRQYLNVIVLAGIGAAIVPVVLGGLWKMVRGRQSGGTQKTGGR
ncbi:DedA family transmembrane protein [Burkholderia anthina]|uniref:DedA family transmembrane protein n=1 Tax=Burkholderia anthina TaxID=179879 RepID=A0A6P2GDI1_9BURK|nr:DedA family transmembrane protein [Burkholderia anthina]